MIYNMIYNKCRTNERTAKAEKVNDMRYRIEAGIETKTSLTTIKYFDSAEELKEYIQSLDSSVWYVVEYAKTNQEIFKHNHGCEGTKYNEFIKCPKILENL